MSITGGTLPLTLLASLLLSACAEISVTPGSTTTVNREVSGVKRLDVGGGFEVTIIQGDTESLQLTVPEGYVPYVHTGMSGGTLTIEIDGKVDNDFGPKRATLVVKSLEGIASSGGSFITSNDTIRRTDFTLSLSGGSQVRLPMVVGIFNGEASGGSRLNVGGSATISRISSFSGGSQMYAYDFVTSTTSIGASGGSLLHVRASDHLEVNASGGSTVYYKGRPGITTELSGGSRVIESN